MIDLNNTVCDKCGSGHLEDVVVDEQLPKKAPVKKMSEAVKDSRAYEAMAVPAVMRYYRHELRCLNCGYKITYTPGVTTLNGKISPETLTSRSNIWSPGGTDVQSNQ